VTVRGLHSHQSAADLATRPAGNQLNRMNPTRTPHGMGQLGAAAASQNQLSDHGSLTQSYMSATYMHLTWAINFNSISHAMPEQGLITDHVSGVMRTIHKA